MDTSSLDEGTTTTPVPPSAKDFLRTRGDSTGTAKNFLLTGNEPADGTEGTQALAEYPRAATHAAPGTVEFTPAPTENASATTDLPPQAEDDGSERGGDAPAATRRGRTIWKPVAGAVLLALIGWQAFHGSGMGGSGTVPQADAGAVTHAPTHVRLNGRTVTAGGKPLLLLNPGLVAPGGQVSVQGSGFDRNATVDVAVRTTASDHGSKVALAQTTKDGVLQTQFIAPQSLNESAVTVVARERGSDRSATAVLTSEGGAATASIVGKGAGKPGDHVTVDATGFGPGETVRVYWGRSTGTPSTTLAADASGSLRHASVPVGMAPVGTTTLVLVGDKTHSTAIASFQMLGLYPTTRPQPYSVQSGNDLTYSGSGFAPGEQVLVYFNASSGMPALTVQASQAGDFVTRFTVPFGLTGSQTLTAIGEQSRAATSASFAVQPYLPTVQASTYGALPGTAISFYAKGFAPGEVVEVYLGRGQGDSGKLVTAFRVDGKGSAAAAGQFIIPSGSGPALSFTLVGQKSGGSGVAKVGVTAPAQPVDVPQQPPYVLPPNLGGSSSSGGSSQAPAAQPGPASQAPASQPDSSSQPPSAPTK